MATKMQTWVESPISPYRLASVLSEALDREVAPQVLYAKTRSGSLEVRLSETGHQVIDPDVANAFIQAQLDKAAEAETEEETE